MKFYCILLTFIQLICHTSMAQTFSNLTITEGLSDMSITSLYKDKDNYVWLGGSTALNRFDGKNINQYPFSKYIPRTKSAITFIHQTSQKEIWVGNYAGIWKLDMYKDTLYPAIKDIDFPVYSLKESSEGRLYLATYKGFYYYENGKCENVILEKNILSRDNQIADIQIGQDNTVWILTLNKLYHYHPQNKKISSYIFPEKEEMFSFDRVKDVLYIGTKAGNIYVFDIKRKRFNFYFNSSEHTAIQYIKSLNENKLYFLQKKLYCLNIDDHSVTTLYPPIEEEDKEIIKSFLVLPSGQVWIGLNQSGVIYSNYINGLFQKYQFDDFDSQKYAIYSFYNNGPRKLIGTNKGLFYINETKKQIKHFSQQNSSAIKSNNIADIAYYNNKYYILSGSHISILDEKNEKLNLLNKKEFSQGIILSMHIDRKGNLWIGKREGLYCYQIETGKIRYNSLDGLGYSLGVYSILSDQSGRVWLATGERLGLFNPENYNLYPISAFPASFPYNQYAMNLHEETDGSMVFCMSDGRLIKLNPNIISFETLCTIKSNQLLKAALKDLNGNYWLMTDCNVYQLLGHTKRSFNITDGLTCSNTTRVFQCDEKGIIWIGTKKGLFKINPNDIEKVKKQSFPLLISDILIDGKPMGHSNENLLKEEITIQEGQKIAFDCILMNYAVPGTSSFEYFMEGYDTVSHFCSDIDEIAYYNLPKGKYIFKIHSAEQIENEKRVFITVESKASYTSIILGSFLLSVIFYLIYLKRKMPSKVLMNEIEEEVEVKYATSKMDNESMEQIYHNLLDVMEEREPWKNSNLKMHELANLVNCSPYSLSQVFSMYLKMSFNDFINQYRVDACKSCMVDRQYDKYSLDAIYEFCGFSSRSSFFRWFKKYTGVTPNEYKSKLSSKNNS